MQKYLLVLALFLALGAGCVPRLENPAATPDGDSNSVDEGGIPYGDDGIAAPNPDDKNPICKDTCGNGTCEEIVCQGSGCPCAESIDSCPQDCS